MARDPKLIVLVLAGSFAGLLLAGCNRGGAVDDAEIDKQELINEGVAAEPPKIYFPPECQQSDPSLNAFIDSVLDLCRRGDYDKFCNLFGASEVPPTYDDFKRIWQGVREISVRSVHAGRPDKGEYFVHAIVKLRKADGEKRTQREIVVRVFRELEQWRISAAPKEIVRKVLTADSQPASGPAERPAVTAAGSTSRPGPSTAPTSRPSVYNGKGPVRPDGPAAGRAMGVIAQ
jgi:hypothetical protein